MINQVIVRMLSLRIIIIYYQKLSGNSVLSKSLASSLTSNSNHSTLRINLPGKNSGDHMRP